MAKKKEKKVEEPQYYMSPVGVEVLNYRVYHMKPLEKLAYTILAFVVGAAVAYLFYGGIGKNEFGEPTMTTYILNTIIMVVVGIIAAKLFVPVRREQILNSRKKALKMQFRELLDSVSTSLGSGQNVVGAFQGAHDDLLILYNEKDFIIQELKVLIAGINNNIEIERLLVDFGHRSGVEDIESFANVFETAYRKGGNIKDIIQNTQQIIVEKMEIENEIDIMVSANKMEQNIMMVMPIGIVGMIKSMGAEMGDNYTTPSGIAATTIGVVSFVVAYFVGKKIMDIKI